MSENPGHERWKALAELLGAEVNEQTAAPAVARPSAPDVSAPVPPAQRREPKPAAPKRERHWGWVASELGLASPPEPASVLEPSSPVAEPELESAAVIPDVVAVPVASEAQETGGQDSVPADAPDADRIDPLETAPTCFVEEVADALELTTADDDVAGNLPADADDAEPATRRRRRRRGRRRRREDSADDAPAGEDQEDAAEAGDVVDERDAEAPAIASEPDADSEERRPKRRRRKRRRTPREANRETADADDTPSADDDEPDDSEDDDQDLDDDDTAGEGVRPKHRRIPSWGEAIDHIVSNNMASRSRNSGGGQRHRGRK